MTEKVRSAGVGRPVCYRNPWKIRGVYFGGKTSTNLLERTLTPRPRKPLSLTGHCTNPTQVGGDISKAFEITCEGTSKIAP